MAGPESKPNPATSLAAPASTIQSCSSGGGSVLEGYLDDGEPRRIAGELAAACRMGYLAGAADPEAAFIAKVIYLFHGRVLEY